ncbi:MAG: 23S rRNA pseudouridine(1911/1915/1917) synthase RluD [Gammaproteobacteria bacterium]|nr:MAG: 23S rRNA pseudouridine(1911/1915/1917) synthase RluD [Gammaproteobacteria bacterium]
MREPIRLEAEIPPELQGLRLDQALARLFPDYSRSRLTQWVRSGQVLVDGRPRKPREPVLGGEQVRVEAELEVDDAVAPEPIALDIVYRDEALLVVNKPAGLVVHPAAGHAAGTLQNALLHHDPGLAQVPRAGIVHRLDKDTSGLMVVARSIEAHHDLVAQLQARSVRREYLALVQGELVAGGTIEAPIGRHPVDRKRQAVTEAGREAITHYRIERRYTGYTLLRVSLETGRTHQIRVHMAHVHHPLVGDPVYGGRPRIPRGLEAGLRERLQGFPRQALHAQRLGLLHPQTGEEMQWEAPLPQDMAELLQAMEPLAQ